MELEETRGRKRKTDEESVRRGKVYRYSESLANRIDQVRNGETRAAWIRDAIEDKLRST